MAMTLWPKVLVVGGSIGGLTTAVLLRDLGCEVDVYERSGTRLADRGAGIVVLPITERLLRERGHDDVSLKLTWWKYVDRDGNVLSADRDNFRFSGWSTLYRGLMDAFGPDHYHLDAEMVGLDKRSDGVTIRLADGRSVDGDFLVCADGISSMGRRFLLPGTEPGYAGYVAWRGVTPEQSLSPRARGDLSDSMIYQILDRSHILVYAIPGSDGSSRPGDRMVNFVWYSNYPVGEEFDDIMTDVDGNRRAATIPPGSIRPERLGELMGTARNVLSPTLCEVVEQADEILIQAILDLESPRMVFGRRVLIGDAAFAVRPHVAAGQAKACADAWALRDALKVAEGDIDDALARWEGPQLELGACVVARSRQMGRRVQVEGSLVPGDPTWKFGLYGPRD